MEHYFTNNPTSKSEERLIEYKIKDKTIKFISDNGVFSKGHVDIATNFMLNVLLNEKISGKLLDVGCGYGAIGITLSKFFNLNVTMLDINERALNLATKNVKLNQNLKANSEVTLEANSKENINENSSIKIIESDGFEKITENYDVIVTNPPIRAGKAVIYKMYEDSYNHLNKGGTFYLVINKKHGAPSTKEFLTQLFGNCEILDKKTGFQVMKCTK